MRHAKSRHTKEAFEWIISILRNHKIPFEIIGGFAARLYGSRRMLADIDIDICGAEHTEIFDRKKKKWAPLINNLAKHVIKNVYGMKVPVTTRKELIDYKKKLSRRVDKMDVKQIEK